MPMFALVYRWRVKPDCEARFVAAWTELTEEIADRCGSLGSRLHRCEDGIFLAYAAWPSQTLWEESVLASARALRCRATILQCAERISPDLSGEVLVDRLRATPAPEGSQL